MSATSDGVIVGRIGIAVGSIVQVDPARDKRGFGGCLLIVTRVEPTGVIGYAEVPGHGPAFHSVAFEHLRDTGGRAAWVDTTAIAS